VGSKYYFGGMTNFKLLLKKCDGEKIEQRQKFDDLNVDREPG
jgi:hypothetical protein